MAQTIRGSDGNPAYCWQHDETQPLFVLVTFIEEPGPRERPAAQCLKCNRQYLLTRER